jgi:hypothetical protein
MPAVTCRLLACSRCSCSKFQICYTDEPKVLPVDYGSSDRVLMGGRWADHKAGGACECGHSKSAHTLPIKTERDCPNVSIMLPNNRSSRLLEAGRGVSVVLFWSASGTSFGRNRRRRTCEPKVKEVMSKSGGCIRALEILDELATNLTSHGSTNSREQNSSAIRVLGINIDESPALMGRSLGAGPEPQQSVVDQFPHMEHAWTNETGTR